ncbi:MAG: hypothetical protein JWO36_6413 [Myxococcales bacterium]|nr:hypothetical protein [Myxococcales bacterium]
MYSTSLILAVFALLACKREAPPPPPSAAVAPIRGAVGDTDLRVMLAEIASSKACEMIEGQFTGLPAPQQPNVLAGTLWIRRCKITHDGTRVDFELAGNGWQWIEQTSGQAGGSFGVRQYVRFSVDAKLRGAIDIAYDRTSHVASLWFTPSQPPVIAFHPIGGISVDPKGLWSSVLGGVSSAFSASPGEKGTQQAQAQGTQQFMSKLSEGLTFAIDLCTGAQRSTLGRAPKGTMGKPGAGQSHRISVELQPGGLMVLGPQRALHGMTVNIVSDGPIRVGLVCSDRAAAAADAFLAGRAPPRIKTLGQADIRGHGRIKIKPATCPVAVVARSIAPTKVTFDWLRSPEEQARSSGGPIVRCVR